MQKKSRDNTSPQQAPLFRESETLNINISEAAKKLNVSTATIRNWLKTGYLTSRLKGTIDSKSLDLFIEKYAGSEKLTGRANKSCKDFHDHQEVVSYFLDSVTAETCDHDLSGNSYQQALSNSYRNKEGIYYTPPHIVTHMFSSHEDDLSKKVFCDPCCGSGNFIVRALELGFRPENIMGFDTDPVAVELTKTRIQRLTGYDSPRIYNDNFLEKAAVIDSEYDAIYTNPPWGKKLIRKTRVSYAAIFNAGKSNDTCSLFFFACLKAVRMNGHIGLLLPEAFFNIAIYKDARKVALQYPIKRLIDYKKPFSGLITRAQAIILHKKSHSADSGKVCCEGDNYKYERSQGSFLRNPGAILNFYCAPDSSTVIDHVFKLPHVTLENNARWGLGIVTGNNRKWARSSPAENHIPVFKGSDIQSKTLKKPTHFIPSDFSLYQQVAPVELYEVKEKLIYRFICSDLTFFADSKQRYILNSANMLIPDEDFPISCTQLADLLNSDFMNWFFKNIFNTHKILRGDLETLPIHVEYFEKHQKFEESSYLTYLGLQKNNDGTYEITDHALKN